MIEMVFYVFAFNKLMVKYYLKNTVLFRENFLRLTMGFGYFMYSHSLVPVIDLWISGRDKPNNPKIQI